MNKMFNASKWQQENLNPDFLDWEPDILTATLPRHTLNTNLSYAFMYAMSHYMTYWIDKLYALFLHKKQQNHE